MPPLLAAAGSVATAGWRWSVSVSRLTRNSALAPVVPPGVVPVPVVPPVVVPVPVVPPVVVPVPVVPPVPAPAPDGLLEPPPPQPAAPSITAASAASDHPPTRRPKAATRCKFFIGRPLQV